MEFVIYPLKSIFYLKMRDLRLSSPEAFKYCNVEDNKKSFFRFTLNHIEYYIRVEKRKYLT